MKTKRVRILREARIQILELDLEHAMQEQVRDYFENKDDSFAAVLAAYEMEDVSVFPKTAFRPSMVNLTPDKYWKYI